MSSSPAQLPPELLHDPPAEAGASSSDEEAVAAAVERMAAKFVNLGVPRMPSRVFFAILTSPEGALTAAEIAERLSVSPAAVSKAVQYLVQTHIAHRSYVPGSRRDRYEVDLDFWPELLISRTQQLRSLAADLDGAVETLGGERDAAAARLAEMRDFLLFAVDEVPTLVARWRAQHRRD